MYVLTREQLPLSAFAREFIGDDHGGVGICLIFTEAKPGQGPALHKHPYEEVHLVQEGTALFVADGESGLSAAARSSWCRPARLTASRALGPACCVRSGST